MSVVKVQVAVLAQFRFSTDTSHVVAVEADSLLGFLFVGTIEPWLN